MIHPLNTVTLHFLCLRLGFPRQKAEKQLKFGTGSEGASIELGAGEGQGEPRLRVYLSLQGTGIQLPLVFLLIAFFLT
jgi:hypothetical protein